MARTLPDRRPSKHVASPALACAITSCPAPPGALTVKARRSGGERSDRCWYSPCHQGGVALSHAAGSLMPRPRFGSGCGPRDRPCRHAPQGERGTEAHHEANGLVRAVREPDGHARCPGSGQQGRRQAQSGLLEHRRQRQEVEPDANRDQRGDEHRYADMTADCGDGDDQQPLEPVDLMEPPTSVERERPSRRRGKETARGEHQPHRDGTAPAARDTLPGRAATPGPACRGR